MIVPTSLVVNADYATLVTDFIVTNSYLNKNGYPHGINTYLNTEFNKAKQAYSNSGITLKKMTFLSNGNHIKSTRAEQCPNYSPYNYSADCTCVDDSQCNAMAGLHHTNIDYIKSHSLPSGSPTTNINIMLTANPMCYCIHNINGNYNHYGSIGFELKGYTFTNAYSIMVKDTTKSVIINGNTIQYSLLGSVMAHEIAHLYGLNHHYLNPLQYNTMDHDCIYGANKYEYFVVSDPDNWFCNYCQNQLYLRKNIYNQTL